jgi:hypothetical protein
MSNYDIALAEAIDRDLSESERLRHMSKIVAEALDALAPDCVPLQHPDAMWHPETLLNALTEAAAAIRLELHRCTTKCVVLEDW